MLGSQALQKVTVFLLVREVIGGSGNFTYFFEGQILLVIILSFKVP